MKFIVAACVLLSVGLAFGVLRAVGEINATVGLVLLVAVGIAGAIPFAKTPRGDVGRSVPDARGHDVIPAFPIPAASAPNEADLLNSLQEEEEPKPMVNVDGTPMVGDLDLNGNFYGMTGVESDSAEFGTFAFDDHTE